MPNWSLDRYCPFPLSLLGIVKVNWHTVSRLLSKIITLLGFFDCIIATENGTIASVAGVHFDWSILSHIFHAIWILVFFVECGVLIVIGWPGWRWAFLICISALLRLYVSWPVAANEMTRSHCGLPFCTCLLPGMIRLRLRQCIAHDLSGTVHQCKITITNEAALSYSGPKPNRL